MSALKTLVLGGYGNFGARIARALAKEPGIDLVVGGRDLLRAAAFAAGLGGGAQPLRVDATRPSLADTLQANGFGLVIHTAGPFQAQGHGVAIACAAAGWQAIHSVDICIAPAQSAPRGVATLAGVLSYCGAPVSVWQEGRWQPRTGWAQPEPVRFARLNPRLGALCDVPDLAIFPERYRVRDRVMFRAALEVGLSQRAFAWIAAARSKGWLFRPEKLARLLARLLAQGHPLPVGAHTATGLLPLASFAPEFARWGMVTDEA
ncbi:MAG: saccharopine dehydrogenase NADP-binding domain-containing protein [Hydrogenophaga sp.]|uniref:saccharopine dehydrogenase NADP-binding domain-containing protein n=1 Tax=Hydrogenophaga sp. TaxID=1904254 RepID=UPI003D0EEE27